MKKMKYIFGIWAKGYRHKMAKCIKITDGCTWLMLLCRKWK